jgi:hypothetical protein
MNPTILEIAIMNSDQEYFLQIMSTFRMIKMATAMARIAIEEIIISIVVLCS